MSKPIQIYCTNLKRKIDIAGGETLLEVAKRLRPELGFEPICAHVNNKTEAMSYPFYAPKDVEFLDRRSHSGERAYVRSLCMMLYSAVHTVYPGARLRIEHSISHGYFARVLGADAPLDVEAILAEMHRLTEADLPFVRHEGRTPEVIEMFTRQGLDDKVRLIRTVGEAYMVYYTLGELADSYYGCLAPSTGHIDVYALEKYHDGLLLRAFDPDNITAPPQRITQEKMYRAFTEHLRFNAIVGISNVGELNEAVDRNHTSDLVNVVEALHDKYLARISDEISARYRDGGARIVLIAGPSSSGKTTTTKRLAIQLMTDLLKPVMISLDDYFVDREHTPRDADGEYDYENLHALDLKLFNADLQAIIDGREVELPSYSFELGRRVYKGNRVRLGRDGIILIEGIHGLNPELTAAIDERMKYRIYVSALTTLSIDDHNWVPTTDNRLLRRIIRDYKYRGTGALETLRRWPSVRRGEERWIFPYQENADATFNSSLLFELGVMKEQAEQILRQVRPNVPEYARAYRLRKFLSYFRPIPMAAIPPTSLLREFLGGSSFHY